MDSRELIRLPSAARYVVSRQKTLCGLVELDAYGDSFSSTLALAKKMRLNRTNDDHPG